MKRSDMRFCPRCATTLEPFVLDDVERLICPDGDCRFVFYDNPTPVVAAIVEHEGDVILVQNKGWPASWFGLVSGFLERNEHPADGVLREIKEEINLDGEVVSLVGLYPFEMMNQIIIAYHVRATGQVEIGDELEAFKRVHPDTLKPWPMGTGQAVKDWLDRR